MSKTLQNRLRLQARVIEELFRRHGLIVHVDGGVVGSNATTYRLRSVENAGWERLFLPELTQDLAETLGVPDVRVRREYGQAQVEVSHGLSAGASFLELLGDMALPPLVGLLGVADGQPLLLNLASPETAHMLVVGERGTGKSALLRSLALSLALHSRQAQLQFVCFLPSAEGRDEESPLQALARLPHLMTSLVGEMEDVREVLAFVVAEIDYRRQAGVRLPHLVVLLDNASRLFGQGGDDNAHRSLQRLLADGHTVGIHVLAASRPPAAAQQQRLMHAGWPVRVLGRLAPALAEEMGMPEAARLAGQGAFLIASQGSELAFQAADLDDYDLHLCLDELQNHRRPPRISRPKPGTVQAGGRPFLREGDTVSLVAP